MPTFKDLTEEPSKAASPPPLEIPPILPPAEPFRGIEPFRFCDQIIFSERRDQAARLLKMVFIYRGTLLAGGSGVGKSSLVNAGFLPGILQEVFLPERVRVRPEPGAEFLAERISLGEADQPPYLPSRFISPSLIESSLAVPLEQFTGIVSAPHPAGAPLLVFDQFEELITLFDETPDSSEKYRAAQIAQTSIIRTLARLLQDPAFPVKFLFVFREDYYLKLGKFFDRVPGLREQGMYLEPLPTARLKQLIRDPFVLAANAGYPFERPIDDSLADEIAKAIAAYRDSPYVTLTEVQIICQTLWRDPHGAANFIAAPNKVQEIQTLLERYIDGRLAGLSEELREPANAILIRLITTSDTRNIVAEPDLIERLKEEDDVPPAITTKALNELVTKSRLVNRQKRGETAFYDIVSEFLIPWIRRRREAWRAERLRVEQAAQRRKQHLTAALAGALAIALLATLWGGYYAFIQEHRDYYREFVKHNGFPVGITKISESTARRLPVSFRLTHKGIFRDGWKLHWKPVFRAEAVNGFLELTPNHSVFPYLWKGQLESEGAQDSKLGEKGEQLGLKTVCQWEFVSTTKNEIMYERALDRAGRMVYGLIYSPPGSDVGNSREEFFGSAKKLVDSSKLETRALLSSTRLARFVGQVGFPLLLRRSAAEYVQIHYDKKGWEDRVMYRDGKGLAAAGPDSAFGQSMQHDESSGRLTRVLSLNADGEPMIDDAGNSGMQSKYDERGFDIEDTSVGSKLEPMPVKDGYLTCKNQYDEFGRLCRFAYYGLNGEPVLSNKDGYHGWEAEYDEHGNETVESYIDKEGKPIAIPDGYATLRMAYDSHGKLTLMRFYGIDGEPVLSNKDGYHGWEAEYDEHGNETVESYIDKEGKPMPIDDGYAILKMAYDARGNVIRKTLYAANGEPVLSKKNGYHGWEANYDERGKETVETYLDKEGKPMLINGYATLRMAYDSHGKLALMRFYDVDGNPVLSKKDGYHGLEAEYDERGNLTVGTYLGKDTKPMVIADGYATLKMAYDARGNLTLVRFYDVNGEPVLSKKEGYHGREAEYDERGKETVETYLDKEGKPMLITDGYATRRMVYDSRGNEIRETYHGVNGEPVQSKKNGYHGWEAECDEHGKQILTTYIAPTLIADGYATMKSTYDARGNAIRQTFYGAKGEPVRHKDGYYGREAEYDEQGNRTVVTYLGLDWKPIPIADGYATMKSTYDSRRNVIRQTFYAANGEPVLSKDEGYHGWEAEYDERNKETVETYLGLDDKPMSIADGYATVRMAYDSRGNVIRKACYAANGEPVLSKKNGYHGFKAEYDEQDHQTVETYLGLNDKPMSIADGYATVRMAYDSRGNVIRRTFHGVNGEPVQHKEGCYGQEAEYDEQGNRTVVTNIGLGGKPTLITDGYVRKRMAYDSRGNVIRLTFHGVNGEPVLSKKDGYHGWEAEYDENGHQTVMTYLGKDGRLMLIDGYATMKSTYDARGNVIRQTFHGVNGEPALSKKHGYHGWEAKYDEKGSETNKVYLGLDGKPLLSQGE